MSVSYLSGQYKGEGGKIFGKGVRGEHPHPLSEPAQEAGGFESGREQAGERGRRGKVGEDPGRWQDRWMALHTPAPFPGGGGSGGKFVVDP